MPDLIPSSSPLATLIRPGAMAESRDRWRELALLGAAMLFETDERCRLVLVEPAAAFGWNATVLLGQPLSALFDPQGPEEEALPRDRALRDRRAWLLRPDGERVAVTVSTARLRNGGLRGAVQDRNDAERERRRLADALSRRQMVQAVATRMRGPVLPDTMVRIGLNEIMDALGAEGALVLAGHGAIADAAAAGRVSGTEPPPPVTLPRISHRAGLPLPVPDAEAIAVLARPFGTDPQRFNRALLSVAAGNHFSEPASLVLWRPAGRPWGEDERELAEELAALLGGALDHEQVQRDLARRSGNDILTGLLTRDSFRAEALRRVERMAADGAPTSLMVIGLDGFGTINAGSGYEAGDDVLRAMARMLRDTFRPTDLVARLHGDVFAVWLDGADQFAAAERAETLCQRGLPVPSLPRTGLVQLSVGMSLCQGRQAEAVDSAIEQASAALHAIKLAGGGRWHVYNEGVAG